MFVRLCKNGFDTYKFVQSQDILSEVLSQPTIPWYMSTFKYTEKQVADIMFKAQSNNGKISVAGIHDVVANMVWWDFDDKDHPENALASTKLLVQKLIDKHINKEAIQIWYSGYKGYHVIVQNDKFCSPQEIKEYCSGVAEGLPTLDVTLWDPTQILRCPFSINKTTTNYKIPIHVDDLFKFEHKDIVPLSKYSNMLDTYTPTDITFDAVSLNIPKIKPKEKKALAPVPQGLDIASMSKPVFGWKPYKWALAQGFFEGGERHHALTVLAATCRGMGYTKDLTYYMCKSALKSQALRTGQDDFSKEELWTNIIEGSIFKDSWNGGQYSPENDAWLNAYCKRMGFKIEKEDGVGNVDVGNMFSQFQKYAVNLDKNIIKMGLDSLDKKLLLTTSTLNGLLAAPGAGKSTLSLQLLQTASLNSVRSIFFSMDMGLPLVYAKLIQRETGLSFIKATEMVKNNDPKLQDILKKIGSNFNKVKMNFRSAMTVGDIERAIDAEEDATGDKVKLVIVDYLECLSSSLSDPTASSGLNAALLKDLANIKEVCIILLLQTQKHSTGAVSDPLMSLRQVKGSSLIEQSCSTITTLWREGYDPRYSDVDNFLSMAIVKNRFGGLWCGDYSWDGPRGMIFELGEEGVDSLKQLRENKAKQKLAEVKNNGW